MKPALIRKLFADARTAGGQAGDAAFSWAAVEHELGVTPAGEINIAQLAVDRHAHSAHAEKTAFRFLKIAKGVRAN